MLLPRQFLVAAIGLLASSGLVQHVAAQVTTDCQPLDKECPPNPALGMELATNFNTTPKASVWDNHVGSMTYDADLGAGFTIDKQGDSPTIRSKFYFFWGRSEIWMKAAHGTGVISSIMLLSDDLDEIDWEFLGSKPNIVSTNYFGKGAEDFTNGKVHEIGNTQDGYRNYTINWTKDALDFYVDGGLVRTLLPKDANNTRNYPQTPMRLFLGIWAGGDPRLPEGTREWAGGTTDYSQGPFSMHVRSATVQDFSSGKEYVYGDRSGSWESIQIVEGNSTVKEEILAPPEKSLNDKWNELPSTAKTAVYACSAGLGTVLIAFGIFYCIRQRRRGTAEAKIAEAKWQQERMELDELKKAGINPDSFVASGHEYNAKEMREDGISHRDSYSVPNTSAATPTSGTGNGWQTAAAVGVGAAAGAGAATAGGAMRSPMPLLRDGAQSPQSPQSAPFNAPYTDRAAHSMSPAPSSNYGAPSHGPMGDMRSQSPGMGPGMMAGGVQQAHQPARSFTSPAPMRMGSPGPQQQPGFDSMAHPQPQRSFTTQGGYPGQLSGNGGWNQNDQGYWNGGYR